MEVNLSICVYMCHVCMYSIQAHIHAYLSYIVTWCCIFLSRFWSAWISSFKIFQVSLKVNLRVCFSPSWVSRHLFLVLWLICLRKAFHCSYTRTSVEYICLFFESLWESCYWRNWRFIWWKIWFWWFGEKSWFICYPGDDSSQQFLMLIILYCIKWQYSA